MGDEKKKYYKDLEDLPGIGEVTAEKLRAAGYGEFASLAAASAHDLAETVGMGVESAKKAIEAAKGMVEIGFESADIVYERRKNISKIKTGSKALDELLGGGVETMAITEAYGKFSSGKCVSKDTPLIYFNSSQAHIEDMSYVYDKYKTEEQEFETGVVSKPCREVNVLSLDENGKFIRKKITGLYKEKVQSIVKVETDRGTELKLTEQHPLFTLNEDGLQWKSTGLLNEGDYIASARVEYESESQLNAGDAYFLGLFVAEGTANPLSISNKDQKINKKLHEYMKGKFGIEPTFEEEKGRTLLPKKTEEILGGLCSTNSATKYIPESVLNGNIETQKAFLSGYVDGDGFVSSCTEMTTKSKKLAGQLSYLLSRLGVNCTIKVKLVDGKRFYRVFVVDTESKMNLITALSESTKEKDVLTPGSKTNGHSKYGIPSKAIYPIIKRLNSKLSGVRRRGNKLVDKLGKMQDSEYFALYYNYIARKPVTKVMTKKTMELLIEFYGTRIAYMQKWAEELKTPTSDKILESLTELPFQSKEIGRRLELKRSSFENYVVRGMVAQERVEPIAIELRKMIHEVLTDGQLLKDVKTLKILADKNLQWEKITSKRMEAYDDYVYDVEVEDTHNFIGGFRPMLLHNSQLGFQLSVNAQRSTENGGLGGAVLFIDTEATFRPERIVQIAEAEELDPNEVLKNIHVARAENSDHQIILAERAHEIIEKNNIKLIVVDSLTSQFRAEYLGRGALGERQQKLNKHVHMLQKLAEKYNLAVYITNQVMDNPGILFGDPTTPIGGHILAHSSTYRMYVRKSKDDKRIARLVDSPNLPEGECVFRVTSKGVTD